MMWKQHIDLLDENALYDAVKADIAVEICKRIAFNALKNIELCENNKINEMNIIS